MGEPGETAGQAGLTEPASTEPATIGPGVPPTPSANRPRRLRALLIGSAIAVALAIFLFVGLRSHTGSSSGTSAGPVVPVGGMAPGFTLPPLIGGKPVSLDALGKDRHHPVILNFFASWCIPCQQETLLLARTAKAAEARGSTVQFVGVDVADQRSQAVPFVEKSGLTYPIGVDATLKVAAVLYGLNGQPQTFFIDASGHVVGHIIGPVNQTEIDQWMHRLGDSE